MFKKKENPIMNAGFMLDASKITDSTPTTTDEAQAKAVTTLAETKDFRTMSEMDENEIKLVTALDCIGRELGDDLLCDVVEKMARWKVSNVRKGRLELVTLSRSLEESQVTKIDKLKRFFGFGSGA